MGRKRKDEQANNKENEIADLKRQHDREKTDLIEQPNANDPNIDRKALVDWSSLQDKKFNAIKAVETVLAKVVKKILAREDSDNTDDREYIALLSEMSKHAKTFSDMIDRSIPHFYDPREETIDQSTEIIIKYEVE